MAEKYGNVKDLTFPQKIDHYFTYYWKLGLGVCIVLAVVIAGVVSILSNEAYDTSVLMVTRGKALRTDTPLVAQLAAELERYTTDVDGNGEVNVLVDAIPFPAGTEASATDNETAMQTRLAGELQLGDSQFFIMDKEMYDYLVDLGGFLDLTNVFPERDIPMMYAIPLSETVLYDMEVPLPEEGLAKGQTLKAYGEANQEILGDLYLVFRTDGGLKPERRAVQYQMFLDVIADAPSAD